MITFECSCGEMRNYALRRISFRCTGCKSSFLDRSTPERLKQIYCFNGCGHIIKNYFLYIKVIDGELEFKYICSCGVTYASWEVQEKPNYSLEDLSSLNFNFNGAPDWSEIKADDTYF